MQATASAQAIAVTIRFMKSHHQRPLGALFLCAALSAFAGTAQADDQNELLGPGYWRVAMSPYSVHFRYNENHRAVWALGLERQRADNWMAGASFFSNSFGQPSSYTYVGKRFPALWGQPQLFGQISGGVLYGYRGEFAHKVPLNYKGFSPGALVTLGWQYSRASAVSAHLLGDAGMMFQWSLDLR